MKTDRLSQLLHPLWLRVDPSTEDLLPGDCLEPEELTHEGV